MENPRDFRPSLRGSLLGRHVTRDREGKKNETSLCQIGGGGGGVCNETPSRNLPYTHVRNGKPKSLRGGGGSGGGGEEGGGTG